MRSTILIIACIAYATATLDSVVPEETSFALDDDLSEARQTIGEMKSAGKSESDCRKLVKDTKDDIKTNVKNSQHLIDQLETGEKCLKLGLTEVAKSKERKKKTDEEVVKRKKEVEKYNTASVTFGTRTFGSLKEGDCGTFFTSTAYTTAAANLKTAKIELNKASGAAAEADTALKNAISAAATAKHNCLCKTREEHLKTFQIEDSKTYNAANIKAWNYAFNLECVLDGKTSCTVPAPPRVKRAKLHAAVTAAQCTATKKTTKKTCVTEVGRNFRGIQGAEDIRKDKASDTAACSKKCAAEAKCDYFVFVTNGDCWLKKGKVTHVQNCATCTSGKRCTIRGATGA